MRYIILVLLVYCVISTLVGRFLFGEVSNLKEDNTALRLNNEGLITTVKEYNDGKMEASKTIVKIQEKIKYIKTDCDCYNMPIPADILQLVRGK